MKAVEAFPTGSDTRVLLVDDVTTTGTSIRNAYEVIADTGAQVVLAVVLVDRGDIARRFFESLSVPYYPLLTYRDLDLPPYGTENLSAAGGT